MTKTNPKGGNLFGKVYGGLLKAELAISITAFTLMLLDVLAGIIMRKFMKIAFPWGEEAARYLMITGILAGLGICARERAHLSVDLFCNMLPKAPRRVVAMTAELCTIACYAFLTVTSAMFVVKNSQLGQISASLRIPLWCVYCILLLGFLISLLEELFYAGGTILRHRVGETAEKEAE